MHETKIRKRAYISSFNLGWIGGWLYDHTVCYFVYESTTRIRTLASFMINYETKT